VPVALEVASALKAELDLIVCRKVPMLLNPEGSLGAATDDGTVILNEEAVKRIGLSRQQLEHDISRIRADIKQRSLLYKGDRPIVRVSGKTVIIIDDGLASGYTMMAAVESVRHRRPGEIVVAVPVASAIAVKRLEKLTDKVVTCTTSLAPKFYISDFYRYWYDLSDKDVIRYLKEWRAQRFRANIEPPRSG
jgi:predicted phosphoribosyltransferase